MAPVEPDEKAMIGEDFVEVFFHQPQHVTVRLGDDRSFAVDVRQDAERAEMISGTHLARNILTATAQSLTQQRQLVRPHGPSNTRTKMYAGRIACCLSHGDSR